VRPIQVVVQSDKEASQTRPFGCLRAPRAGSRNARGSLRFPPQARARLFAAQRTLAQDDAQTATVSEKELARAAGLCDIEAMRISFASAATLCFLAILLAPLAAQDKSDAVIIRDLEMKWADSYKQRKVDILSSLLAEDFVITIEDGSTYSKTGYISHSAEPSVRVQLAEPSDLKVRMHGNTAVVTGAYHERGESDGKPYEYHDRFTDVWMKSGGKWQVVASHYSVPVK